MVASLNVIALISGGKDSLYSILHCIEHGHKVVALANLQPDTHKTEMPGQGTEVSSEILAADMNSFMFQTVGHSIIPLYAQALGIPLFRRTISGSAIVTDRDYSFVATNAALDETEDLVPLLQEVMAACPTADAIVTGAIQSTYQRTRVESVALRLGLTPLSFLWQYPVLPPPPTRDDSLTGLLDDMDLAGCDARIIKIASGGIHERLLWSNVADAITRRALIRGLTPFFGNDELGLRGAVVGEGGEFETLTLDGPTSVWKNGYIAVEVDETQSLTGEGGTSYINVGQARLIKRQTRVEDPADKEQIGFTLPIPALFDPQFQSIEKEIVQVANSFASSQDDVSRDLSTASLRDSISRPHTRTSYNMSTSSIQINNLDYRTAIPSNHHAREVAPPSTSEQMRAIISEISKLLPAINKQEQMSQAISTSSIIHTTIILRSMDEFATINPIYASLFSSEVPNPPARVTISAPLPAGVDVSVSVVLDRGSRTRRRGLHVQSRSYWAPANIGPYSQAIAVPLSHPDHDSTTEHNGSTENVELVHVAGQIPLIPATMEILDGPFYRQALLSLQHLWRLGQERKVDAWSFGVAFLADANTAGNSQESNSLQDTRRRARIAATAWNQRHRTGTWRDPEESVDDEIDIWQSRFNRSSNTLTSAATAGPGHHLHRLPFDNQSDLIIPPFIAAQVTSLPRMAEIEWWSLGISKLLGQFDSDHSHPLSFRTDTTDHYTKSCLTIPSLPENSGPTTRLTALLIERESNDTAKQELKHYATVADMVRKCLNPTDPAKSRLVSGNAFVSIHADEIWAELCATNSISAGLRPFPQASQPVMTTLGDLLGDVVTVTYVHHLQGHGGWVQDISVDEKPPAISSLKELSVAFLFRIETA